MAKISRDGVVLGWAKGRVGQMLLSTSPASENVAVLAAAALSPTAVTAHSDYEGVEHLELMDEHTLTYGKAEYAGVRVQARGRAPSGFRILKSQGTCEP